MTNLLSLEQRLSTDECAKITKFMATSEHVTSKHLNYLIMKNDMPGSGVVQTLSSDLSGFPWKKLIKTENVLDYDAMRVIVSRGGVFTAQVIHFIIMECRENVQMLEFALTNCTPKPSQEDLQKFCDQALKFRKFKFIMVLLSQGAVISHTQIVDKMSKSDMLSKAEIITYLKSTPEGRIELFFKAVKYSEYNFAESLLGIVKNESLIRKIDLSSVLTCPSKGNSEARNGYIAFVKRLLNHGIADSEANSLDIVLEFPKEYEREKIELLILLLEHDAAIERCTHQRKNGTTLLHIATKFAINSGITHTTAN